MKMPTWRTRGVVVAFSVLAVITTFTNKYVLSTLKFTYPTIFQSWQTGTMIFVLLSLHVAGYIELDLKVNRSVLVSWLPGCVFFTGMIYSGSVALSKLPVPVFCILQYTSFVVVFLLEWFFLNKKHQLLSLISLVFIALAAIGVTKTDPQYDHMGYSWMVFHCACTGAYLTFEKTKMSLNLSELNKIFYNTMSSIILLMGISIMTGELFKVLEFPFLYSRQFHVGCLASGLFGALLGILGSVLSNTEYSTSLAIINSINKVFIAVLSVAVFQAGYTVNMSVCIIVGLSSGVLYSYSASRGNSNGDSPKDEIRIS